jgi:hypothetical protein
VVQCLQLPTRLEPAFLDEVGACAAVGLERLGPASAPVQGEHQVLTQPLPERMLGHQGLEFGDERHVPAQLQVRLDPVLEDGEPSLLEALRVDTRERFEAEVRERWSGPQRERCPARRGRIACRARGQRSAALLREMLEPVQIEFAGRDPEQISGRVRDQDGPAVSGLAKYLA